MSLLLVQAKFEQYTPIHMSFLHSWRYGKKRKRVIYGEEDGEDKRFEITSLVEEQEEER